MVAITESMPINTAIPMGVVVGTATGRGDGVGVRVGVGVGVGVVGGVRILKEPFKGVAGMSLYVISLSVIISILRSDTSLGEPTALNVTFANAMSPLCLLYTSDAADE